jgi:glucokinase
MRVLAGDAGGTKTILAVVEGEQASFRIVAEQRFPSRDFPGLAPMISRFLETAGQSVDSACIGVPGAVVDGTCRTPNIPWALSERELQAQTEIPIVELVNDFVVAAAGVLVLSPESLATLQAGQPIATGTRAVLGAGTGLGQAVLSWDGTGYRVIPTEAGHADLAPRGELQRDLAASLEAQIGHVSVERVVSGPGLVRIYEFLVERGVSTWPEIRESFATEDPGSVISRYAMARHDLACEQALDLFVEMYGAEAGNLALRTLPQGGLYVAGGIAGKILDKLREGRFMQAFLDKGRLRELLETIPVHVVLDPKVGLYGAAMTAFVRNPEDTR